MKCKCSAKPKPEVTWYKADKVVKESNKIKIIVNEQEDTYEIICEITVSFSNDSFKIWSWKLYLKVWMYLKCIFMQMVIIRNFKQRKIL